MRLKIITIPKNESELRRVSTPLKKEEILEKSMQKFLSSLVKKMIKADGVGLAAPQVNKPIRAIAIRPDGKNNIIMINPEIVEFSKEKDVAEEGCLSVPNIYAPVERHTHLKIKYLDENSKEQIKNFSNLGARVTQHEVDHLDGILFTDKVKK